MYNHGRNKIMNRLKDKRVKAKYRGLLSDAAFGTRWEMILFPRLKVSRQCLPDFW